MKKKIEKIELQLKELGNNQPIRRVDLLNQLAWEIGYNDLQRAFHYTLEAKKSAESVSYQLGIARSNRNLGFYYYTLSDYDQGLRYSYEALNAFEQLKEKDEEGKILSIIGLIYWSLGNFDLSVDYLNKSQHCFLSTNNEEDLAWTLTSLGGVYEELGDYDTALTHHNKSLRLFRNVGEKLGEARALSGIGKVYEDKNELPEALKYHRQSLVMYQELDSKNGESRALNDIGAVCFKLNDFSEALIYHKKSLELRRQIGNKSAEVTSLLNIGKVFNRLQKPEKALHVLKQAREFAEETYANPKLYQAHQALSEAYEMTGNLQKALEHLKTYQKIREEVFGDEANTKLKNLQIQHEVEKSEKEAEIHRLKNIELKEALKRLKQSNQDLQETQVQLVQSEKMAVLGQLTAGIAHEINSPIGAVKSSADVSSRCVQKIKENLVEQGAEKNSPNGSLNKTIEVLEKNQNVILDAVDRIAGIVMSLKSFARLDEAEYKVADIHEGIESTLKLISYEIADRIEIEKDFATLPQFRHYPNQLNQVFMTILSNAIQAIEGRGSITIKTSRKHKNILIDISDTGKGMPPKVVESLFDLGFTTKYSRVGIGMGLHNAFNIIQKHKGTIEVNSKVGIGTNFLISLPM